MPYPPGSGSAVFADINADGAIRREDVALGNMNEDATVDRNAQRVTLAKRRLPTLYAAVE